jgi:hypothetical protein
MPVPPVLDQDERSHPLAVVAGVIADDLGLEIHGETPDAIRGQTKPLRGQDHVL